jgi:hypothetical protein
MSSRLTSGGEHARGAGFGGREYDPRLAAAMMSVYYHSLGSQLALQGAPAVLLPPAVRPMPLGPAIDCILEEGDERKVQALWTLLRTVPGPPQARDKTNVDQRYPPPVHALAENLAFKLEAFEKTRGYYRWESLTFANALSAYAYGAPNAMQMLEAISEKAKARWGPIDRSFGEAVEYFEPLGGVAPDTYVETITTQGMDQSPDECRERLRTLEDDVGMSLRDLVVDLADAMAFMNVVEKSRVGLSLALPRAYPAGAIAVQHTRTLATTVTVTSLVKADDLQQLTTVLDPVNWGLFSDAFRTVTYVVPGSHGFAAGPVGAQWPLSANGQREALVREEVQVPSGLNPWSIAAVVNLLRVRLWCDPKNDTADLRFSLSRSESSRFLWDEGPGGILVDEGAVRVRPMADRVWRVTMRKTLRFADRTPSSGNDTPRQFGQSLNFLTPAMLIWWVQSDLYNLRSQLPEEAPYGN